MTAEQEETRAFMQERITLLFKTMFWSLSALVCFLMIVYALDPANAPDARNWVYAQSAVGLGSMALIWRGVLLRRTVALKTLHRLDLVYSLGIGTSFGASAVLQHDLRAAAYLSVLYTTFTVFARALIVPSSGRRTAVASAITFAPMTAAGLILALRYENDLPPPAFFVGALLFYVVGVVMSAYGSAIIYGLRRKVSDAEQLGMYRLSKKIGQGGMGSVYLAHHVMLRRETAVKIVPPARVGADALARFEREVQHMSQLTHPNTVAVYDYGSSPDGVFYYAMEYLGGGIDLENLVRKHGPQSSGRVAGILAQACGALNEAHQRGIIHRDIKPANMILCERGGMPDVVKVVDYGLVKDFAADTGASTQVVLGTPDYSAPEAFTDPGNLSPAVDLYAIGCVGYFLLTGQRVFSGKTAMDICLQHVTKPPTPPSQVAAVHIDPALEAILMRCLEKAPAARPANAAVLRRELLTVSAKDWTDADARTWWQNYRQTAKDLEAATSHPTMTMTIDLEPRVKSA